VYRSSPRTGIPRGRTRCLYSPAQPRLHRRKPHHPCIAHGSMWSQRRALQAADVSIPGTYHPLGIWPAMASTLVSRSGTKDTANSLAVTECLRKMNCGAEGKSKPQRSVMRQSSGVDHRWFFWRREEYCRWTSCQPSHISPRPLFFVGVYETLKKIRFLSLSFSQESESQL
jgi:hypothetical protein